MRFQRFVGWLPNVAGRLSFSHIGDTLNPGKLKRFNAGDSAGRLVICYQNRLVSDTMLRPEYYRWLYRQAARCAFVLCAQTKPAKDDPLGILEGALFLIDEERHLLDPSATPIDVWGTVESLVREPRQSTSLPWRTVEGRTAICAGVAAAFDGIALAKFKVTINRDGVVSLCPDASLPSLQAAPDANEEAAAGGIFGYIANQAFFFLKDISHTHRHHAHTSDTITTATLDAYGNSWVADTNYKLHRKLVHMRASRDPRVLFDALGMLTYVSSFNKTAATYLGKSSPVITYNISEIEGSVKARLESARWRRTQMNIAITALPALSIAALNLTKDAGIASQVRDLLLKLFTATWSGWLLVTLIVCQAPFLYGIWSYTRLAPIIRIKRLLTAMPRGDQACLWFFIAFSGFFISFLLVLLGFPLVPTTLWLSAAIYTALCAAVFWATPYLYTKDELLHKLLPRLARYPVGGLSSSPTSLS